MVGAVKVILNPQGGRWTGQVKIDIVEQALAAAGLDYDLEPTARPEDGLELARRAAQAGWPIIVAAGGDGTINQVVNGMAQAAGAGQVGTLGIIPVGTANDLAAGLGLPPDPQAACQRIAAGRTRLIDLGQVNGRYFTNNSAVGLEAVVTVTHDQMRWLQGKNRYLLAALKVIMQAHSWHMKITWDDGQYDGPAMLVSVGNSSRTGGSFYMTPHAQLDDGRLDFIYSMQLGRLQLLNLLPKTFSGRHIEHPAINYRRTTRLSITTSPATPIQADGEVFDFQATHIHYCVFPQKLGVIV
ncbi:MAG: diacylglycerol kinase family protein [Chloroflexota bacterium]